MENPRALDDYEWQGGYPSKCTFCSYVHGFPDEDEELDTPCHCTYNLYRRVLICWACDEEMDFEWFNGSQDPPGSGDGSPDPLECYECGMKPDGSEEDIWINEDGEEVDIGELKAQWRRWNAHIKRESKERLTCRMCGEVCKGRLDALGRSM